MSRIVEYETGLPAAADALHATGATGRHDRLYADDDGPVWAFWLSGDGDEFAGALPADSSVESFERVAARADEHLFQVRLAADCGGYDPPDDVELVSARFDADGLTGRAWCASGAAVDDLRVAATDAFGRFDVTAVYECERGDAGETAHVDASDGGPDALLAAVTDAVADAEGVETDDLSPMYDALDPDLVTAVLRADGGHRNAVSFRYHGHRVVVRGDGTVTVT